MNKQKLYSICGIIFLMVLIQACHPSNSNTNNKTKSTTINTTKITLDTILDFPEEIDGCACYYAIDAASFARGEYIYLNDYEKLSILKINGKKVKFIEKELKEIDSKHKVLKASNADYELELQIIEGEQNGYETSLRSGTIRITDKNGKSMICSFYGECGC